MKDEPAFNARLVGTIEQYPCLYNYKMKEYSNRNTTDQAWTKVAQEMKETVETCKESWRNLRVSFSRSLKKPPSGSGAGRKKKYYLSDQMQFLLPYIGNRKGILPGNIPSSPPALQPDMGNDATDDFLTLDAVNSKGVDDPGIRDEVSGSAADEGSGNAVNEGSGNAADEDFPTADLAPVSRKKRKVNPVDECVMEFIRKKQSTEKRTLENYF